MSSAAEKRHATEPHPYSAAKPCYHVVARVSRSIFIIK